MRLISAVKRACLALVGCGRALEERVCMYARSKFHKAGLGRVELTGPCGVGTSRTSESDGTRGGGLNRQDPVLAGGACNGCARNGGGRAGPKDIFFLAFNAMSRTWNRGLPRR